MDYIIGIDPHGYDGRVSSFCVLKRLDDGTVIVLDSCRTSDKGSFEKQLRNVSELYNIPEDKIINLSDNQSNATGKRDRGRDDSILF